MAKVDLHVEEPWLSYIETGDKTVEGRAGPRGKYDHLIGQIVKFYNESREVYVTVVKVNHYGSLREYLEGEGLKNVLPCANSYDEAVSAYHGVYSKYFQSGDTLDSFIERRGGMLGLRINVVK